MLVEYTKRKGYRVIVNVNGRLLPVTATANKIFKELRD